MTKAGSEKQKSAASLERLRTWNTWLAGVFAVQGVFVLLLSATRLFPAEISYTTRDPIASEFAGHPVTALATHHLFDINLAYLVAGIFFVGAIAHAAAATLYRRQYEADLKKRINRLRWGEYAIGTGLLSVAIALLSGVHDVMVLGLLFALTLSMVLVRLAIELYRSRHKNDPNSLLSGISIVGGAVLPAVILMYCWAGGVYGANGLPVFVYVLFGSTLVLAGGFGANLYLQYRGAGKWAGYLYGERVFMALSLVAKTVLAWQIFAGALRV